MKTFNLPDLGEGLPEAEIVTWHVKPGDAVKVDDLLVSVETAKAVVEVPSPYTGKIAKLYADEGQMVETGSPLVDFDTGEGGAAADAPAAGDDTRKRDDEDARPAREPTAGAAASGDDDDSRGDGRKDDDGGGDGEPRRADSSTVVGNVPTSDDVLVETARAGGRRKRGGRVKAAPAARALARRLDVDIAEVEPSGRAGQVLPEDVQSFADARGRTARAPARRASTPASGKGVQLRGPRRAMAQAMSASRDLMAHCTLFDDADIHYWHDPRPLTERLMRAIVAGCEASPGLNGFFDGDTLTHESVERVDIGMAVDTEEGLVVPVVRDVASLGREALRAEINRIKRAARERSLAPSEMIGYTFTLSNFGMLAGRYATPLPVPPTIAILGSGKLQQDVVPVLGGIEVHRRMPLSLTFDHRCVTGGEACRFLAAVIADLELRD